MAPRLIAAGMRPLLPPLLPSTKTSSPHRFRQDRRILLLASSCSPPLPPSLSPSPPLPALRSFTIALASTTPISVPSTGCRCTTALFRPISLSTTKIRHLFALSLTLLCATNLPHFVASSACPSSIRLIPSVIFAGILLFPRTNFDSNRSIPRERYIIFSLAFSERAFRSIPRYLGSYNKIERWKRRRRIRREEKAIGYSRGV